MVQDNPEQLIAKARLDTATLGRLLEQYRRYLGLLARIEIGRKLQGKLDASDVVQDAFLDAHKQFPNFRGTAEPQLVQWLREILAGTLANQIRRYFGTQARDPKLEIGIIADLDHSTAGIGMIPLDPGLSPSQHFAQKEQSLLVAEAIARLSDDYQTVIILRHIEGLTFQQIAERMERTTDSVEKLWLRAIVQLKKSFQGQEPAP
jgi:RNA polymerase sigma-70 factor, ECF subfamily